MSLSVFLNNMHADTDLSRQFPGEWMLIIHYSKLF